MEQAVFNRVFLTFGSLSAGAALAVALVTALGYSAGWIAAGIGALCGLVLTGVSGALGPGHSRDTAAVAQASRPYRY